MDFKDPIYSFFYAALEHELQTNWHRQQTTLGETAGISSSFMSDIVKKKVQAGFKTRAALAKACGYEYEAFLEYGKILLEKEKTGPLKTEEKNNVLSLTIKQQKFIKNFLDKEAGIEANQYLLELEKLDKDEFYAIIGILRGRVRNLKKKKADPEQAQGK